jgi:hypothetical protein
MDSMSLGKGEETLVKLQVEEEVKGGEEKALFLIIKRGNHAQRPSSGGQ